MHQPVAMVAEGTRRGMGGPMKNIAHWLIVENGGNV